MDQDDRWAGPDIKIGNPLTMDENRLDRERFDRSACEGLKVGRNVCGRSTGGYERGEQAWNEQSMSPWSVEVDRGVSEGTTPVE